MNKNIPQNRRSFIQPFPLLIFIGLLFIATSIYGQCGADGTQPCKAKSSAKTVSKPKVKSSSRKQLNPPTLDAGEQVVMNKVNICSGDVGERVKTASDNLSSFLRDGERERALLEIDVMKESLLQYGRCLRTGNRLKSIGKRERE